MAAPKPTIRLHAGDNVVVTVRDLQPSTRVDDEQLATTGRIPAGHKIATDPIQSGEPIKKYGQIIGFALDNIAIGDHVHTHNAAWMDFDRPADIGSNARPTEFESRSRRATFQGIVRDNGVVATRNYIGVMASVNCAATVAKRIAQHFHGPILKAYPNVDGVVAITHGGGCAIPPGEGHTILQRTLGGYAKHPNFAAVLFVGLGCEVMQLNLLMAEEGLEHGPTFATMTIQQSGGTRTTIEDGIKRIEAMLPAANETVRQSVPASELVLGLECGGSDAYSGISANPALGAAVDLLVRHGGTAILAETPEIYGAEHLLASRAASRDVGEELLSVVRWWETYTSKYDATMDNNPTPGNKAGGLTTILEKSLGAVAKGGTTNLVAVYRYAQRVSAEGLVFMDTPGYDPVSVTGMVAGGANIITFTTGRGSAFGCKPAPSLKLATNTHMYSRMSEDMDINCGTIVDGEATVEETGERIFRRILAVASGERTASETLGYGDEEFVPWHIGPVM